MAAGQPSEKAGSTTKRRPKAAPAEKRVAEAAHPIKSSPARTPKPKSANGKSGAERGKPTAKQSPDPRPARVTKQPHVSWPVHVHERLLDKLRGISASVRSQPLKAEQVHRARRLLKEANALARLLEGCCGSDAREASRGFASLRHRLNDVRDLDVIEVALVPLADELPQALQASLAAAIAERRSQLNERTSPDDAGVMRKELQKLSKSINGWNLDKATPEALADSARRTYKTLRNRGTLAFETREDEALHDLRKPLIVHRYQIEALERAWPKLFRAWATEAQLLRDKLGVHHDLMMLAQFAKSTLGLEAAPLLLKITSAQNRLVKDAEPIFDRLCTEKPGAFERRLLACLSNAKKRIRAQDPKADDSAMAAATIATEKPLKHAKKTAAKPKKERVYPSVEGQADQA